MRKIRGFSKQELANKLNMPLEKYIELENAEKIPAQILLDLSHELSVCDKYLYSGNCPQNNPLCIAIHDFRCPHYTFDKYSVIDSFSISESQTLLKLNYLEEEERSYLLKTIDYLYYKKISNK